MDVYLTTSVLKEALSLYPKPKILNTDQGSQYTAHEHIKILADNEISISMDAKGRSIDNIVITGKFASQLLFATFERFWRTLKYKDIKETRKGIGEYIKIYNKERLHSAIGYLTPDEAYYKCANDKCYNAKDVLMKAA